MRLFLPILCLILAVAGGPDKANASVPPTQRALIIVNELDSTGIPELGPIYSTLENLTDVLPNLPILRSGYAEIHMLRNAAATLVNFRAVARGLANRPEIAAIDVFMVLHGRSEKLKFRDGLVRLSNMQEFMLQTGSFAEGLTVSRMKRKFRMLYSTACFGASHRGEFRNMGFDAVSGAVGVNANAEVEYPSFLARWRAGQSFGSAIGATNSDAMVSVVDAPLVATGVLLDNFLKYVNSKKLMSGNIGIRIDTPAQ